MLKQIQVGSRAFFSQYPDFEPSDNDILELNSEQYSDYYSSREGDLHIFHYKFLDTIQFLNFELIHIQEKPLAACEFIVPEVAEFLELTIDELYMFCAAFNNLTKSYQYAKYIYECYLKNGNFSLTQEQRDYAYELYKQNKK